jgi:hypothetical protein
VRTNELAAGPFGRRGAQASKQACERDAEWRESKVHGENDCDAHRLPAGKTAAEKRERGRLAGQAIKPFEDRQLLLSKASAPFVTKPEF